MEGEGGRGGNKNWTGGGNLIENSMEKPSAPLHCFYLPEIWKKKGIKKEKRRENLYNKYQIYL